MSFLVDVVVVICIRNMMSEIKLLTDRSSTGTRVRKVIWSCVWFPLLERLLFQWYSRLDTTWLTRDENNFTRGVFHRVSIKSARHNTNFSCNLFAITTISFQRIWPLFKNSIQSRTMFINLVLIDSLII